MRLKSAKTKWLLMLLVIVPVTIANAQNLNTPNKWGPLGTQVNTLTGNLFIPRTDVYIPGREFDINISFYYNSYLFEEEHGYGRGWTSEYNIKYLADTVPGTRRILWGDGREDSYDSIPGGMYKAPKGFYTKLEQYQPGKFVLVEPDGIKYFFDNPVHRKITRKEEPNGNHISFTYTDSLLTAVTNAAGQSVSFTYNAQGRLATVVDAIAIPTRTYQYTYDAKGNLKEVKDPLNGTYQYTYLVNGPMKSIADKNNNKIDIIYFPDMSVSELIGCNKRVSFSYDTASRTTLVTDHLASGNQVTKYTYQKADNISWITSVSGNCCGFNLKFEYDEYGNRIKVTDANGQVFRYTYDAFGNVLTATDPLNHVSTYTYTTDFQQLSTYKDPRGNIYSFGYDSKGNLTSMTTPGNNVYTATYNNLGDILSSTDPKGNVFTYNYDAYGNPTQVTGPNGYSANLSFDGRGRLLAYTDPRGNTSSAEYDILDRLKKITDPLNNFSQFNYDAEGNIVSYTNKNNEVSQLSYDASNRLVKVTGPTGNETGLSYDAMDNVIATRNSMGIETKFDYDNRNRVKAMKDAENNNILYQYDGNGNVTGVVLPNGQSINYAYDQLNRIIAITDTKGIISSYSYDQNNNVTSYTNGTGATITATYDSLDRIKQITDPLGNSRSYAYDKNDNITAVTDREGHTRYYTYDSLDRISTYTDNNGFVITASYDGADNIISLKDQNNNITSYTYDSLNRRKTMTYPDGKYKEYRYDKKGNLVQVRLTDGAYITYGYDSLNRLINRSMPDGEEYTYTYDKLNRIQTATNAAGTIVFTYDAMNRVMSETFDGRTTRYHYSVTGRTHTIIYPDSTTVTREFDTRDRLTKLSKNGEMVVEYFYNNADQVTGKAFANGVSTTMQYDFANRLSSISTLNGTIQQTSFTYNKELRKTAIIRHNNPNLSEQFSYDNGYRLINYKRGPVGSPLLQNTYTYDGVGNRTTASLNGTPVTYTTSNLNQLTGANTATFTFDDRGNLTFDGTYHKLYDADNRLIKDSSSPAHVISYGYDAFRRRVVKTINGIVLRYTYSGPVQIEERSNNNAVLNQTVYANFLVPVLNKRDNNSFYYHQNELNSVEAITNANGRLVEHYRYDVYGKPDRFDSLNNPLATSISGNRFGMTGQEYDSATQSYRFFYRNYSPATGTFNQRDLIEYKDGMGMYQYVGNNPANGVDVWGLEECYKRTELSYKISLTNFLRSRLTSHIISMAIYNDLTRSDEFFRRAAHMQWKSDVQLRHADWNHLAGKDPGSLVWSEKIHEGRMKKSGQLRAEASDLNAKAWDAHNSASNRAQNMMEGADKLGNLMNAADNAVKAEAFASALADGQSNEQYTQEIQAGGDLALSLLGWTPAGGVYGTADFIVESATGKGITQHAADAGTYLGNKYDDSYEREAAAYEYAKSRGKGKEWLETRRRQRDRERRYSRREKVRCPEGGTQKPGRWVWDLNRHMYILLPWDPNLIEGPEGQPGKKWVSVKERMPYTILFENDSAATARTRYIRITTPIEPKQDPATLELGSFGFNNQSFDIPAGTSAYYQRLDCRDSTGLYVDITAGYDVVNNQIFWEFQGIDPLTLLPPEDPLAGFLFLQDTTRPEYGNGFVTFSIKPITSAVTLDTIGARAYIIFDSNETIPTNIHTNTIDALPPTSSLADLPAITPDTEVTLTYTGADDVNGSGVRNYSIYIADNDGPPELYVSNFIKTDTIFKGQAEHLYKFYITATDTAGNIEPLLLVDSVRISSGEFVICPNGNTTFNSRLAGTTFQWQVDNGTGYTNVSDGGIYNGASTSFLSLTSAPTSMYGYKFRCLVNGVTYSEEYILKFGMTWEGTADDTWENAANWSCNTLPDMNTDVIIAGGKARYPQISSNVTIRTLHLKPGATGKVNTGFTLTIMK